MSRYVLPVVVQYQSSVQDWSKREAARGSKSCVKIMGKESSEDVASFAKRST